MFDSNQSYVCICVYINTIKIILENTATILVDNRCHKQYTIKYSVANPVTFCFGSVYKHDGAFKSL